MTAQRWLEKMLQAAERIPDEGLRLEVHGLAQEAYELHEKAIEDLRKRLAKLEAGSAGAGPVAYRFESVLWTKHLSDRVLGPFCPECFESDGELVVMQTIRVPVSEESTVQRESWRCPDCQAESQVIDRPTADELFDVVPAGRG